MCLNQKAPSKVQYKVSVFKCFTSWLQLGVISLDDIEHNDVMILAFHTLAIIDESIVVHEAATDVICTLLVRLEEAGSPGKILFLKIYSRG